MRVALPAVMVGLGLASIVLGVKMLAWREAQSKLGLPVDLPLPMSAREFTVGAFTVPQNADYLVAVSADRVIPLNTLDCLLGINDALLDKCEGVPTAVNAAWTLSTDGRQVAHGLSGTERVAGWSNRVYKGIGRFSGSRGQPYTLDVKFLSDTSPLNSAKPHIEVLWLPPANYDEYGNSMRYALAKPAGVAFVLVGVVMLISGVLMGAQKALKPR
jgi:hypothetical protein